ncbi:MAG: cupin domain-containing protein [Gammaproteobacteria bacterium]|nr:cupin domain-containing protein [Gammaproteobacteria bacterium]
MLVDPQPTGQGTLKELSLHQFETESVALVHWPKGEQFHIHEHMGDEETFFVCGDFIDEHGRYPTAIWIRGPRMSTHTPMLDKRP